jgi:acetyl-CoA C-acetyltransferase
MPQKLVAEAAADIQAGRLDVAVICGSEAMYSRSAAKKDTSRPAKPWTVQDPATTPAARTFGTDRMPLTELEIERGVRMPVEIYPLFENARRARHGWSVEEHRSRIAELQERFSEVAAANPFAWITEPMSAAAIAEASASNRMIAEPYTKLMVANMPVDLGAAIILCSLEAARAAGVADDLLVFPHSHSAAEDHWFVSQRPELDRSPAIAAAGRSALALAEADIDEMALIDLYSCVPIAVEMGAEALGLDPDSGDRPLTLTGGLTFGGGPGNNYVAHSIARMVEGLRRAPGELGLLTGLSYFATSHAVAVYGAEPPAAGFRAADVQAEVDRLPQQPVDPEMTGEVTVETFTIAHDRDAGPIRATLALRDAAGMRGWGTIDDPELLGEITGTELCGRPAQLAADGRVSLR